MPSNLEQPTSGGSQRVHQVAVLCLNASGKPNFAIFEVVCTDSQVLVGGHYQQALQQATASGYAGPMVAFSGTDPAAGQLAEVASRLKATSDLATETWHLAKAIADGDDPVRRLVNMKLHTYSLEGEEVVFTDEMRTAIQTLGGDLVEATPNAYPGERVLRFLDPQSALQRLQAVQP